MYSDPNSGNSYPKQSLLGLGEREEDREQFGEDTYQSKLENGGWWSSA